MTLFLLTATIGLAEDPVDLGVLKNSELRVVQKVLYTKEDRLEVGVHLGLLPFDGATVAPQLAGTGTFHFSERTAAEVHVGGGYGFKNSYYALLEGERYGVAIEAYRYLASVTADLQWAPVYAKLNLGNGRILHHDVYLLGGAGATLEQSVFPSADIVVAPGLAVGLGTRIFVGPDTAVRFEIRDNVMYESRVQSQTSGIKQNVALSVGISKFGKGKK